MTGASRRSLLVGLVGGAAATVAGAELLEAKKGGNGKGKGKAKGKGKDKNNDKKQTICHCPGGDVNKCNTITVGKKAAESHLRNHPGDTAGPCDDDGQDQCLPVVETEGEVTEESEGRFTLSTEGDDEQFGVLEFEVPDDTTFAKLESIVADYDFATGTCGGGSPRFVIFLKNGNCPYVQFPPDEDCEDGEGTTGNLIGNNTEFVWIDDLCGGDPTNTTYEEVLEDYGDEVIESIALVVDESPQPGVTEKTVTVDVCISVASS